MKQFLKQFLTELHKNLFKQHYKIVLTLLQPTILGLTKESFGKGGDGTYVLPTALIENSSRFTLLSFGIGDDISFEKDFKNKFTNIDIYAFDPTIDQLPEENKDIQFFKIGLAGKKNERRRLLTLQEIFQKLSLSDNKKYILKIDIEGWEWDFLSKSDFKKWDIPVIVIELHFFLLRDEPKTMLLPYLFYKKLRILKKLLTVFYLHHVHANNRHYVKFKHFKFPSYVELTLVNKSNFTEQIASEIRQFNKPNFPDREDIQFPFSIS